MLIQSVYFIGLFFCGGFNNVLSATTSGNECTYEYIGCFKDKMKDRAYKDLYSYQRKKAGFWTHKDGLTHVTDSCCDELMKNRFTTQRYYFGVQFYGECSTYNKQQNYDNYKTHGVSKRCSKRDKNSKSKDRIGKGYANAVYCAYKCGLHFPPGSPQRIVNGEFVKDHYPWMAYLRGTSHFCGGSLISCQWILTSAHCLNYQTAVGMSTLQEVVVGSKDFNTGTTYTIAEMYSHPNYSGIITGFYDVALIKLSQPVQLSPKIWPICLDTEPIVYNPKQAEDFTVVGWGSTNGTSGPFQRYLKQAEAPISSMQAGPCGEAFACFGPAQAELDSNQGDGACSGDSGGPYMRQRNGRWYLSAVFQGMQLHGPDNLCAWDGTFHRGIRISNKLVRDWVEEISDI